MKFYCNRKTGEIVQGWFGVVLATLENKFIYGIKIKENKWEIFNIKRSF